MMRFCFLSGWLLLFLLSLPPATVAAPGTSEAAGIPLEDLAVIALDPAEGRAVVQLPDGSLRMVAFGEELREAHIRIRKVLADRLVVQKIEGSARSRAWIFRAGPGERSRVQVLDRDRPAPPPIQKPQSTAPEEGSANG